MPVRSLWLRCFKASEPFFSSTSAKGVSSTPGMKTPPTFRFIRRNKAAHSPLSSPSSEQDSSFPSFLQLCFRLPAACLSPRVFPPAFPRFSPRSCHPCHPCFSGPHPSVPPFCTPHSPTFPVYPRPSGFFHPLPLFGRFLKNFSFLLDPIVTIGFMSVLARGKTSPKRLALPRREENGPQTFGVFSRRAQER